MQKLAKKEDKKKIDIWLAGRQIEGRVANLTILKQIFNNKFQLTLPEGRKMVITHHCQHHHWDGDKLVAAKVWWQPDEGSWMQQTGGGGGGNIRNTASRQSEIGQLTVQSAT